ncbi:MAG: MFS transporter [Bifidobacteriaceae bacterium]|jgi:MHS family proline/betaine transporter-like MFS transporter|nr:MFS transporter [Bifidobacteriaceae bacterium]
MVSQQSVASGSEQPRRLRVEDVIVVKKSVLRRAIAGTVVGNLMEWYDVGVYGYLAVTIGHVFLSNAADSVQRLFSLGVFAVTFIARPLGGVLLGSLGDRLGRQRVLAFTLLAMSTATFLIGVLPDFAQVGGWAPLALVVLKLVQGFSTGGEYAGATTLITEYAPDKHRGFYSSLLDVGSYLGFALGAVVVSIMQINVADSIMNNWGWRVPFILALPLAIVAVYFRNRVDDTPIYLQGQRAAADSGDAIARPSVAGEGSESATAAPKSGFSVLFHGYWRQLLIGFTLVATGNTLGYTLTSYMPTYLTTTLHYDTAHGNLVTIPVLVLLAGLIPVMGALSDRFGRKTILLSGALLGAIVVVPAFLLMMTGSLVETFFGLLLLSIPMSCLVANIASTLPALFPTSVRYSGMGISYNFAATLFAGTAPLIMESLVTVSGNALAPAFWIIFTSAAGVVAALCLKESARKPMLGAMPTVSTEAEARQLVATQDSNPDLDVAALWKEAASDRKILAGGADSAPGDRLVNGKI